MEFRRTTKKVIGPLCPILCHLSPGHACLSSSIITCQTTIKKFQLQYVTVFIYGAVRLSWCRKESLVVINVHKDVEWQAYGHIMVQGTNYTGHKNGEDSKETINNRTPAEIWQQVATGTNQSSEGGLIQDCRSRDALGPQKTFFHTKQFRHHVCLDWYLS